MKDKIIVFEDKRIRRTWFNDEWWYSVVDIVAVLTDSPTPRQYWGKVKQREFVELELYPIWVQLKLESSDGKRYNTDCVSTKGAFRLIQSIPSKKAEPFKQWLAQLGKERIEEIEDPELAQNRAKEYYELKEYPKSWIDKRLRGIAIRQELTEEWKNRGIEDKKDFAILTNEIHKATFDISIQQHKDFKNLPTKSKSNLRDNMSDLELIFNMLGEKVTTEITSNEDKQGFEQCCNAANRGGKIAGNARAETEKEIGKKVLSKENYLENAEKNEYKRLE